MTDQTTEAHLRALTDRARDVVEKWEALPDKLPAIDGLVPLNQAIMEMRAFIGEMVR